MKGNRNMKRAMSLLMAAMLSVSSIPVGASEEVSEIITEEAMGEETAEYTADGENAAENSADAEAAEQEDITGEDGSEEYDDVDSEDDEIILNEEELPDTNTGGGGREYRRSSHR